MKTPSRFRCFRLLAAASLALCFQAPLCSEEKPTTVSPRPVPKMKAIIPARSIGSVRLGGDANALGRLYGSTPHGDSTLGGLWMEWRFRHGGSLGTYSHWDDKTGHIQEVRQIRTTSAEFSTAAGVRVGSSLAEVREKYPHLQPVPNEFLREGVTAFDDVEGGIAFVFRDGKCTTILVHPAKTGVSIPMIGGGFWQEEK